MAPKVKPSFVQASGLHMALDSGNKDLVPMMTREDIKQELAKVAVSITGIDKLKIAIIHTMVMDSWDIITQRVASYKMPNNKFVDTQVLNPKEVNAIIIYVKTLTGETISQSVRPEDVIDLATLPGGSAASSSNTELKQCKEEIDDLIEEHQYEHKRVHQIIMRLTKRVSMKPAEREVYEMIGSPNWMDTEWFDGEGNAIFDESDAEVVESEQPPVAEQHEEEVHTQTNTQSNNQAFKHTGHGSAGARERAQCEGGGRVLADHGHGFYWCHGNHQLQRIGGG